MIIKTEKDELQAYLKDETHLVGNADIVYIPENIEELKSVVRDCYEKKKLITLSGAKTGLTGGKCPNGGAVISTELLNSIVSIKTEKQLAVVQPGLLHSELQEKLNELGYFLPPNPTEKNSSIGGNVSTNASGARTYKYGSTRAYVQTLKIILVNGDELELTRKDGSLEDNDFTIESVTGNKYKIPVPSYQMPKIKHAAGYYFDEKMQAIDLFIGSEGTLGIIAEMGLKFLPKPDNVFASIIFFESVNKAIDFVTHFQIEQTQYSNLHYSEINFPYPRLIEFFEENALNLLKDKYPQIPDDSQAAIWIEQEYLLDFEQKLFESWESLISKFANSSNAWIALTDAEHEEFREFRHTLPLKINELMAQNQQRKVGTDIATPARFLGDIYNYMVELLNKKKLDYVIYGHIGNSHLHANVFYTNEEKQKAALDFYDEIIDFGLKCNGTVSAEHGIGKLKKKFLLKMYGENGIDEMKQIKAVFDPDGLLGKGTMFD